MNNLKRLEGRRIESIEIDSERQEFLRFNTDAGPVTYFAYGDCCSQSWFADITGSAALIGGTVILTEEVSMDGYNVNDGRGRQDEDSAYGFKIQTDRGHATIVFRNSSNGYYGGQLDEVEQDKAVTNVKWTPIVEDYP